MYDSYNDIDSLRSIPMLENILINTEDVLGGTQETDRVKSFRKKNREAVAAHHSNETMHRDKAVTVYF